MKTNVYIDGYNLFYGCLKHSDDKWLDLYHLFANRIIHAQDPNAVIETVYFFTADIKSKISTQGEAAQNAQQSYHRALQKMYPNNVKIIKGYYALEKGNLLRYKQPPDKSDRVEVWRLEEKQTDVNITLTAYRDAIQNKAEQVVFVTNDTDIEPALKALREDMGDTIIIGIIIPIRSNSRRPQNERLSKYADWTRSYITDDELADSHLPDKVPTAKKPILKPEYW
ncbi:NYN domain-containing protein [Psychrobacter aquaticus]|uniref:NYN domain-containing protein n=1 Tax=Psychrobacter aquaticus CMS 56 TaxID=1354303 RepID=U4T6D1_9GAMM|nr:NYN domain-containing protein [Psychrobacter aquaticus]ERL54304.1 hypothetical protein M917_2809 [Psychrobacter aquaticus CMS 56]